MKTASFLLMTIGWAALMHGIAHAATFTLVSEQISPESAAKTVSNHTGDTSQGAPAEGAKDQKNGKSSDGLHVLEKNLARNRASLIETKRSTLVPSKRAGSGSATAIKIRRPGSNKFGGAGGKALIPSEALNSTVPVRSPIVVRPAPAAFSNVRHRSPNPAIISGLVNSKTWKSGAINGTHMDRRR
jgi:hypothetical protein